VVNGEEDLEHVVLHLHGEYTQAELRTPHPRQGGR
jgi:hypothetical protein